MSKNKGFVICEQATTSKPKIVSDKVDSTIIKANLQDCDVQNRNKRVYPSNVLREATRTPYINERIKTKTLYGECGHPLSKELNRQLYIDQTRISHIITELSFNGNMLQGTVESAMTSIGKDFRGLIRQGSEVAFSMRGVGPIDEEKSGVMTVKSPLRILTWDWVIHPSHSTAYMQEVLKEDTLSGMVNENSQEILNEGIITPFTEQQAIDYIRNESKNVKNAMDQFGIESKKADITLDEDFRMVNIRNKEDSNILKIFLEDYVIYEIDDYLAKL